MKAILIVVIAMLGAIGCLAQSNKVIVGTKKVYLKYAGSYSQKDSLLLPVVSARYPALKAALSDTALFAGDKLENIVLKYRQCACGTTGFNYDVVFLNDKLISITLFYEGMGAYPSSARKWLTLSITTGKPLLLKDELTVAGLEFITRRYKRILLARIKEDKVEEVKEGVYGPLLESGKIRFDDLAANFTLGKKGIMLMTEDALPHVTRALEPNRDVFFSYAQLRPFFFHLRK